MKPNTLRQALRLLMLCLPLLTARAADPSPAPAPGPATPAYTYTGEILGVACSACSRNVKAKLEKMPGVTSVKVVPGKPAGTAGLEIISTSPDLTKDTAVKALGKYADAYQVQSLRQAPKS